MAFVPLNNIPIQLQDSTTSVNMSGGSLEFYLAGTTTPTAIYSDNTGTSVGATVTLNSGGYPELGGNVLTLFRDSDVALKIICKDSVGATIWTADNLSDGLVILASISNGEGAALVGVEDAGLYFTGADVEAVLQDIGANYLKTNRSDTITGTVTFAAPGFIDLGDQLLQSPEIRDYSLTHNAVSSTSGTLVVDLSVANSYSITLTENVTAITINNIPASGTKAYFTLEITQDGAGGAYTVAMPGSVIIAGGATYTMSTGNDAVDELTFSTRDGGTTWKVDFSQAYA